MKVGLYSCCPNVVILNGHELNGLSQIHIECQVLLPKRRESVDLCADSHENSVSDDFPESQTDMIDFSIVHLDFVFDDHFAVFAELAEVEFASVIPNDNCPSPSHSP